MWTDRFISRKEGGCIATLLIKDVDRENIYLVTFPPLPASVAEARDAIPALKVLV